MPLRWKKTGSITQAAANLYMDQPNLSKAIKTLEESLERRFSDGLPKAWFLRQGEGSFWSMPEMSWTRSR
uniref:helix-turn-helix domain-containing protein n=1 Tax=Clostridium sp. NkU-1 TaxID=1095009 RepID=UPI003260FDB3